jgi:hypothetical protein
MAGATRTSTLRARTPFGLRLHDEEAIANVWVRFILVFQWCGVLSTACGGAPTPARNARGVVGYFFQLRPRTSTWDTRALGIPIRASNALIAVVYGGDRFLPRGGGRWLWLQGRRVVSTQGEGRKNSGVSMGGFIPRSKRTSTDSRSLRIARGARGGFASAEKNALTKLARVTMRRRSAVESLFCGPVNSVRGRFNAGAKQRMTCGSRRLVTWVGDMAPLSDRQLGSAWQGSSTRGGEDPRPREGWDDGPNWGSLAQVGFILFSFYFLFFYLFLLSKFKLQFKFKLCGTFVHWLIIYFDHTHCGEVI